MVALFDLLDEFIKRIAGTIYYDKEFIVERLADDGLRLELDEVDTRAGEHLQHLYERTWLMAGSDHER